jgi:pyruvate formate lyase activating enzyme
VEKDIPFFDQSNGGVTISGGEPLFQPDFLFELLKSLKEKDIHTVVDTSGWQIWDIFDKIRKYVDLFLYDCKIVDRKKHLLYTGVDNQLIIDNLRRLSEHNHPIDCTSPVYLTSMMMKKI